MGIGRVGTAPPRPASHYLYKSNPKDHRPRFPLIITCKAIAAASSSLNLMYTFPT